MKMIGEKRTLEDRRLEGPPSHRSSDTTGKSWYFVADKKTYFSLDEFFNAVVKKQQKGNAWFWERVSVQKDEDRKEVYLACLQCNHRIPAKNPADSCPRHFPKGEDGKRVCKKIQARQHLLKSEPAITSLGMGTFDSFMLEKYSIRDCPELPKPLLPSPYRQVWLDCDPGAPQVALALCYAISFRCSPASPLAAPYTRHDDAIAIMVLSQHPDLQLVGVSTVGCNQSVDKTTKNALAVLHACGRSDIPVYRGQAKPIMRSPTNCAEIHGNSGLDGPAGVPLFPDFGCQAAQPRAVLAMAEAIAKARDMGYGPVDLVCTACLTNVALMITLFPEIATSDFMRIVLMGGAMGIGNTGPVQEFNIQTDPEAASIVFESGLPCVMLPIEVTHTVLATPEVKSRIAELQTPFASTVLSLLEYFEATYRQVFHFQHPPVHDPVAAVYILQPSLFKGRLMRVDVETKSTLSPGQTVCDVWNQNRSKPKNVVVIESVEVEACWNIIIDCISRCNVVSPLNGTTALMKAGGQSETVTERSAIVDSAVPNQAGAVIEAHHSRLPQPAVEAEALQVNPAVYPGALEDHLIDKRAVMTTGGSQLASPHLHSACPIIETGPPNGSNLMIDAIQTNTAAVPAYDPVPISGGNAISGTVPTSDGVPGIDIVPSAVENTNPMIDNRPLRGSGTAIGTALNVLPDGRHCQLQTIEPSVEDPLASTPQQVKNPEAS